MFPLLQAKEAVQVTYAIVFFFFFFIFCTYFVCIFTVVNVESPVSTADDFLLFAFFILLFIYRIFFNVY